LQGFSNEEISKSEILDMVCAIRSFENIDTEMFKNCCTVILVKWASSITDTVDVAMKMREKKGAGRMRMKFVLLRDGV
jgi:hypothetical protein